jgi:hypothetical protein
MAKPDKETLENGFSDLVCQIVNGKKEIGEALTFLKNNKQEIAKLHQIQDLPEDNPNHFFDYYRVGCSKLFCTSVDRPFVDDEGSYDQSVANIDYLAYEGHFALLEDLFSLIGRQAGYCFPLNSFDWNYLMDQYLKNNPSGIKDFLAYVPPDVLKSFCCKNGKQPSHNNTEEQKKALTCIEKQNKLSELVKATGRNLETIKNFICENKEYLNLGSLLGDRVLYIAAQCEDAKFMKDLLKEGVTPNALCISGIQTFPLIELCRTSKFNLAAILINHEKFDPNLYSQGSIALAETILKGQHDFFTILLQKGARLCIEEIDEILLQYIPFIENLPSKLATRLTHGDIDKANKLIEAISNRNTNQVNELLLTMVDLQTEIPVPTVTNDIPTVIEPSPQPETESDQPEPSWLQAALTWLKSILNWIIERLGLRSSTNLSNSSTPSSPSAIINEGSCTKVAAENAVVVNNAQGK